MGPKCAPHAPTDKGPAEAQNGILAGRAPVRNQVGSARPPAPPGPFPKPTQGYNQRPPSDERPLPPCIISWKPFGRRLEGMGVLRWPGTVWLQPVSINYCGLGDECEAEESPRPTLSVFSN